MATLHHVLAGHPPAPDRGIPATVACELVTGLDDTSVQDAYERSGAAAYLVAPYPRVLGERGTRRLVVGQIRVAVTSTRDVRLALGVEGAWSETGGWHHALLPIAATTLIAGGVALRRLQRPRARHYVITLLLVVALLAVLLLAGALVPAVLNR
ncbi:hypothetical protein BLA60_02255 [Actinophytocola xinjiangensis]|uniref:Uncharacterized protein n=1 Tax=Actinophytocola xinjiangensis TaxID=485602 RepID=A0A7Z1B1B9_9PSEU|nr:hypothetical protein [Actinophytocola xinjiangensis]OLF14021.1 hypothetical protein BLA60_02255 [Actinophytocola xinjiangensis]